MLLLGIDTSSQAATAALSKDGAIICEYTLNQKKTHSAQLLPMIEQMLKASGYEFSDIDAFACGVGPGSFTGVRIGVTTVKGFAQALNKPVIAADSLEILAFGCTPFDGMIVSAVFARVDEVFCAAYEHNESGLITKIAPSVMTIGELLEILPDTKCLFVGDGAVMHKGLIKEKMGEKAYFAGERQNIISAANLALLCDSRTESGFKRYDEISPLYLRVSQAEREYEEKHKGEEQ
ncbi:MAG: tRNA (adenosine(37)-N6)-threonylcarbamoyltransferase complex dimerization subunit type 1 TsaB [Clostridia bacterium]|nr:tRNA (adenosine(37)-N6)-threonylcarbamoyltransferase complex dimerization subunit type 1 TsaB [Clostridia bacterium]